MISLVLVLRQSIEKRSMVPGFTLLAVTVHVIVFHKVLVPLQLHAPGSSVKRVYSVTGSVFACNNNKPIIPFSLIYSHGFWFNELSYTCTLLLNVIKLKTYILNRPLAAGVT